MIKFIIKINEIKYLCYIYKYIVNSLFNVQINTYIGRKYYYCIEINLTERSRKEC